MFTSIPSKRCPAAVFACVTTCGINSPVICEHAAAVKLIGFSAHKASSMTAMIYMAVWTAWAAGEPETRARAAEALPQPTKAEGHAQKGDVDSVEHGGAAHGFAAAHAPRQREAKQARQTEGQGAGLKNSGDNVKETRNQTQLTTNLTTRFIFTRMWCDWCKTIDYSVNRRYPTKESVVWRAKPIQNTPTLGVLTGYRYFEKDVNSRAIASSYAFALRHQVAAHALKGVQAAA